MSIRIAVGMATILFPIMSHAAVITLSTYNAFTLTTNSSNPSYSGYIHEGPLKSMAQYLPEITQTVTVGRPPTTFQIIIRPAQQIINSIRVEFDLSSIAANSNIVSASLLWTELTDSNGQHRLSAYEDQRSGPYNPFPLTFILDPSNGVVDETTSIDVSSVIQTAIMSDEEFVGFTVIPSGSNVPLFTIHGADDLDISKRPMLVVTTVPETVSMTYVAVVLMGAIIFQVRRKTCSMSW